MDNKQDNKKEETKYQSFKKYSGIFYIIVASIALFLFFYRFDDVVKTANKYLGYIMPVLYGIFIAYLLNPIVVFFAPKIEKLYLNSKKEKTRAKAQKRASSISIAIAMTTGILIVVVLCIMIIPNLLTSIIDLSKKILPLLEDLTKKVDDLIKSDKEWAGSLQGLINNSIDGIKKWINLNLIPTAQNALTYISSGVASIVMFLYNFLVGIVVAVYALSDKKSFTGLAKKLSYALLKPKTANRIIDTARHGHMIFGGFLTGQIISSIIVAVICFFFSIIARMPYPLLLCVIIGVTNIIPFFGPFIGGIPATLLVAVIDPVKGLIFGIFIIILQQIDGNIISAKILGNVTGISEFWVTFALLLFGGMFGFVGMIVGVPLFAALYYILKTLVDDRMQKKKFATKCEFYLDVERYNEETQSFEMIDSEARLEAKILKRQLKEWKLTKFVKSKIFKNSKKK